MDIAETKIILGILKCEYDNCFKNFTKKQAEDKIALWAEMFRDIPLDLVKLAVKKLILQNTTPFAPKISDIMNSIADLTFCEIDSSEAWGQVVHAINYYGSYREADAISSMSETTQKVVKRLGFRNLCFSENHVADRAHFIKLYDVVNKRERENKLLPESCKNIALCYQNNLLGEGE